MLAFLRRPSILQSLRTTLDSKRRELAGAELHVIESQGAVDIIKKKIRYLESLERTLTREPR